MPCTRDLSVNCLLGMDVLTKCPLTQGPIKALYDAVTSKLQTEVNEIEVDTELSSACYRSQVLTPGELSIIQQATYDVAEADLPNQVFHDVFQVVDACPIPEPPLKH